MQGLADGYFVIPYTLGHYLASNTLEKVSETDEAFKESAEQCRSKLSQILSMKGSKTVDEFHKELGAIMWDKVGMSRDKEGLEKAQGQIRQLREEFWNDVKVLGEPNFKNAELEKALRVADFLELGELLATDASNREESCGGHFRYEYQTPDNEALRNDESFCHASAWENVGSETKPSWKEHKEPLNFEYVKLSTRSYK